MLLVCYPKCSTCRRAEQWLEENSLSYTYRDIKTNRPSVPELKDWHQKSGLPLKRFFNTSGQAYRELGLSQKLPTMSEEDQLALLATDGMLVKRPLAIEEDRVLVGFKEVEWKDSLLKQK